MRRRSPNPHSLSSGQFSVNDMNTGLSWLTLFKSQQWNDGPECVYVCVLTAWWLVTESQYQTRILSSPVSTVEVNTHIQLHIIMNHVLSKSPIHEKKAYTNVVATALKIGTSTSDAANFSHFSASSLHVFRVHVWPCLSPFKPLQTSIHPPIFCNRLSCAGSRGGRAHPIFKHNFCLLRAMFMYEPPALLTNGVCLWQRVRRSVGARAPTCRAVNLPLLSCLRAGADGVESRIEKAEMLLLDGRFGRTEGRFGHVQWCRSCGRLGLMHVKKKKRERRAGRETIQYGERKYMENGRWWCRFWAYWILNRSIIYCCEVCELTTYSFWNVILKRKTEYDRRADRTSAHYWPQRPYLLLVGPPVFLLLHVLHYQTSERRETLSD